MNWPSDFTFFADEDLGTLIFPEILRGAGVTLETLSEHYALGIRDTDWIPSVAQRGWVIITHDRDIRYNQRERDAVMQHGGRAIIIRASGTRAEIAQIFVGLREQVTNFLRQNPAPFIARLYRDRIEMWLSRDDWTP